MTDEAVCTALDESDSDACTDEAAVVLSGVTKRYGSKVAVDNVDLVVPRGSVFGLIGPNGAGKTTTLKMMATLIKPDCGDVRMLGHDLKKDVREVRPFIGYMPDAFGVFRGLTCEEYLGFFGRAYNRRGPDLKRRVEDVLTLTDLTQVRDELTTSLSTGMKQRLSLAKTLVHDPEILVLDEPASGLDPRARIEIRSLLTELGRMGKTIVISSHILADLEEICTDVAIVEEGALVWTGSIDTTKESGTTLRVVLTVPEPSVAAAAKLLENLEYVTHVVTGEDGRLVLELTPERGGDSQHGEAVATAAEAAAAEAGEADAQATEVNSDDRKSDGGGADLIGNRVLSVMVEAGIEVIAYSRERHDLEALFLERTRGIVS